MPEIFFLYDPDATLGLLDTFEVGHLHSRLHPDKSVFCTDPSTGQKNFYIGSKNSLSVMFLRDIFALLRTTDDLLSPVFRIRDVLIRIPILGSIPFY
jgi:hypothetical protein